MTDLAIVPESRANSEVMTPVNKGATGIETVPFQNPSRNGMRERLIFQHPSRAISVFQKDLFLECENSDSE